MFSHATFSKNVLITFVGALLFNYCIGQNIIQKTKIVLEGHWQGAFIKNNSFQKFDIQFYDQDGQFTSLQIIEEWHPQFGEFVLPVKIDSTGLISFNTGHGRATMHLDSKSLELAGHIEKSVPAIYVHFKKIPTPPKPNYSVDEIEISHEELRLHGHLHVPHLDNHKTAIILVGGRGCYAGSTKYDLYAKLLRDYGISVLVFNKRGTGKSTGNCQMATIDDLADDVVACKKFLEEHPNEYETIGVLGSSAGGWVMLKAEEKTDFDFMVSIVGPSTSVKEQQLQSMEYGFEFYDLSPTSKTELMEYTEMMFSSPANKSSFKRFQELLILGEKNGWKELLDETDIPPSASEIESLWVRRHNFDPDETLSHYDRPFLAIYGEIDWIVPYKENIQRLEELFKEDRNKLLTTMVAFDAEHGTETAGKYITLGKDDSYWRFFRISPIVQIALIDFLKDYNFAD